MLHPVPNEEGFGFFKTCHSLNSQLVRIRSVSDRNQANEKIKWVWILCADMHFSLLNLFILVYSFFSGPANVTHPPQYSVQINACLSGVKWTGLLHREKKHCLSGVERVPQHGWANSNLTQEFQSHFPPARPWIPIPFPFRYRVKEQHFFFALWEKQTRPHEYLSERRKVCLLCCSSHFQSF